LVESLSDGLRVEVHAMMHRFTASDTEPMAVLYLIDDAKCDGPLLPQIYEPLKEALSAPGTRRLLVILRRRGSTEQQMAAGLRGFIATAAKEFTDVDVRLVVVTAEVPQEEFSRIVLAEVRGTRARPVVTYTPSGRHVDVLRALPIPSWNQPPGHGGSHQRDLGLGADSVVVLYGGARGITSHIALALAEASGARLELVGSTAEPDASGSDPYADEPLVQGLRAAVIDREAASIRDAELVVRRVMAQREIRETLRCLRASGARASYASVDVRDTEQVAEHLRAVHARHGRIDAVVFGSGVNLDQLIGRTSQAAFERVFNTKVLGIRAVLSGLAGIGCLPGVVTAFGSIAAVDGNPGQVGYTAANDAMESILAAWGVVSKVRTVTVNWGPWAPRGHRPGMVSPELEREFLRRGKQLLDPLQAAACLLDELADSRTGQTSVVWAPAGWVDAEHEPMEVVHV
jgi:NAD(P)-dependent dehydrogenase (short-subunit alcohol dehydrogenase family)